MRVSSLIYYILRVVNYYRFTVLRDPKSVVMSTTAVEVMK